MRFVFHDDQGKWPSHVNLLNSGGLSPPLCWSSSHTRLLFVHLTHVSYTQQRAVPSSFTLGGKQGSWSGTWIQLVQLQFPIQPRASGGDDIIPLNPAGSTTGLDINKVNIFICFPFQVVGLFLVFVGYSSASAADLRKYFTIKSWHIKNFNLVRRSLLSSSFFI